MSKVKVKKNTKSEEKDPIPTQNITITPEEKKAEPSLVVVTRKEWGAAPPNFPGLQQLKRPAMTVMLRYFTGWEICHTADECIPVLRGIQRRDQNKNLVDIAHNFLIGPDGTVFEGRGWTESESPDFDMAKVAQQIKQPQTIHQSIINLAYIGNFEGEDCVTEVMKKSLRDIIDQGIRCYQIAEKHKFIEAIETPGYDHYNIPTAEPVQEGDADKKFTLQIIPRSQWCRQPPKWRDPLRQPVPYVYSTFTRKSHCYNHDQCFAELQYLHYRSTKYGDKPDIIYNFLIGGDGTVYEGRGWTSVVNLPKRYQAIQDQCISIAMMGTFQYRPPAPAMKKAQNLLIKYGMDNNYIRKHITHFTT